MGYASQAGRARTSPSNPQAHAICDRCGFRYNFVDLRWQFDWSGTQLRNLYLLVCKWCLDTPQEQLRAIVVPADPLPIPQARVQDFNAASTDQRTLSPGTTDPVTGIPVPNVNVRVTQTGDTRTSQTLGQARPYPASQVPGLDLNAVPPLDGTVHYGVALPILSVFGTGTTTVSATCSAPHGLTSGQQIAAQGLSNEKAAGFFNVTVTTATTFTWMTNDVIKSGSLLTSGTLIETVNAGIPRDYAQIPQTGI